MKKDRIDKGNQNKKVEKNNIDKGNQNKKLLPSL